MARGGRPSTPFVHVISLVCSGLVILLGVGTVVSWQLLGGPRDLFSNRLVDGIVAAAFVACGVALLLVKAGWLRVAAVLGGSVSLLGLLVFLNDVLELDLGIDAVALENLATARSIAFVSIAPTTLMAFVLAGAALIALGAKDRYGFVAALLGTLVATLALAALVNGGVSALTLEWLSYFRTEPVTAVGLIVLGIGLTTAALDRFDPTSEPSGWAVPLAVGTTTLLVGMVVWHGLRLNELRQLERSLDRQAESLSVSIRNNMALVASFLAGFPYQPESLEAGQSPSTIRPASAYFPGLSNASWIDVVDPSAPPIADAFAQIPRFQFLEGRYEELFEAEGPIISGPTTLQDGGIGFWIVMRRDMDDQSRAFLSGMIAASTIFSTVPQLGGSGFDVMVLSNQEPVFLYGDIGPDNRPAWGRSVALELPGPATWELIVSPRSGLLESGRSALPEFILGASLLVAVLLTALTRTAAQARHRAWMLERDTRDFDPTDPTSQNARVDRLIANIGNEIRNPVAVIRNVAELLQLETTDEQERPRLHAVLLRQSARIRDVMNATLDFQVGAGSSGLVEMQSVDLTHLVLEVVNDQDTRADSSTARVAFRSEQGAILIKADRELLGRAFQNLLDYATRHTPRSESVEVSIERTSDREACVTIRDRGPAIEAGEEENLFAPHLRRETTSPRTIEGTLMLTAAKRVVELHGGRISVIARAEGGLDFRVSLPGT